MDFTLRLWTLLTYDADENNVEQLGTPWFIPILCKRVMTREKKEE